MRLYCFILAFAGTDPPHGKCVGGSRAAKRRRKKTEIDSNSSIAISSTLINSSVIRHFVKLRLDCPLDTYINYESYDICLIASKYYRPGNKSNEYFICVVPPSPPHQLVSTAEIQRTHGVRRASACCELVTAGSRLRSSPSPSDDTRNIIVMLHVVEKSFRATQFARYN